MPTHVHILPEQVANLIAAGEVVERPASVVKELIENSLDAGARQIEVEIRDAGFSLMRVTDDGHGLPPEDAKLAFYRHATSKVSGAEDLNHITTLGFRGEALPSIAAVARVEMVTRPPDQPVGYRLVLAAGTLQEEGETGCAAGTTLTVRDLFFNTPARRKFMKSPATEHAHIVQMLEWVALAHPDIRFRLLTDGREAINVPATTSLAERVAALYGKGAPRQLLDIDLESGGLRVHGLAASPEASRPVRQGMYFFVNHRPVEHRGLFHAVQEAYKPLLPEGRFPVCFVYLDMPAHLVDVNVHPAKREVRLRDEHAVHDLVLAAVRDALGRADLFAPSAGTDSAEAQAGPEPRPQTQAPEARQGSFEAYRSAPAWSSGRVRDSLATYLERQAGRPGARAAEPPAFAARPAPDASAETPESAEQTEHSRIIGQVGRTYIAAQDDDGFFLVDQHAAHERLLYEELRRSSEKLPRQGLLLPLTFELPPARAALMSGVLDVFHSLGVEISAFGRNTFVIQTQPQLWEQGNLVDLVQDLLDWIAELDRPPAAEELKDRTLKLMACHAAIKAGDRLQPEAMQVLVRRLGEIPPPLTCPHGRPLVYRLSWQDLDRLFKRA